jgi:hypothetical protein
MANLGERRRLLIGAVILATGIALAGCGTEVAGSAASSKPDTNYSASQEWLGMGQDILDARAADKTLSADLPPVLSKPVDITQPGTYNFVAGPVPRDTDPTSATISMPPDLESIDFVPPKPTDVRLVTIDGASYVELPIVVKAVRAPYAGLTLWFH